MNVLTILRSVEELLYEVISWLLFYPRTLWMTVMRPLRTMRYSDSEQRDRPEQQYLETLSPPLFLVLSILLAHGAELAFGLDVERGTSALGRLVTGNEQALLAFHRGLEPKVMARVPEQFSLLPRAGFEVRAVEPWRAQSAAGGSYMRPSGDGSRPGVFYVNSYDLPTRKTWDAEDLFLHEAIPGHHFQLALQQELEGLPAFRRYGGETAFTEGWGLYAESLGRELGLYQDPYSYFGYLQNELWRAIRLVVDTGLHHKGWSRQQVIEYMLENSASSRTDAVAEAERYMAIPGQALAYKIGELKIKQLRRKAQASLGPRFDPRDFHAQVLKDGSVPLDVLEAKIDAWIAATQAAE